MASRPGLKLKKSNSKSANSPQSSTTTSSSKLFPDNSADCLSSPASSARSKPQYFYSESLPVDGDRSKENVTVTVRFRPLSPKEIRQGEEIAWYADGETIVRSEHNSSIAYAYDKVFGPTTTTRHVYDVAAQHVIGGAMEGINGTIFAYGVTSSGKTHTMHGDQRSPGIIPLAVKDAFSIIQETPSREYLLRVSYLEIYNEVVNDLLNPAGQNLRIREDAQGTFVEGIKEEVVLSPAHALSLIAAGEGKKLSVYIACYLPPSSFLSPLVGILGSGSSKVVTMTSGEVEIWNIVLKNGSDFESSLEDLYHSGKINVPESTTFPLCYVSGLMIQTSTEKKHMKAGSSDVTLGTIESSPCGENSEGEAVNLSQLNLIDLAGSESSKAETTGVRRKEGSYINKSLLTLGTVRPQSLPLFNQCNSLLYTVRSSLIIIEPKLPDCIQCLLQQCYVSRGRKGGKNYVRTRSLHYLCLKVAVSWNVEYWETIAVRRVVLEYWIGVRIATLETQNLSLVISKLTDGRASHIPYRDSKLTRLLQSSLSGHGRVSLICTVTPSSSNSEETHNTLKFAHRAKHIEIQAAQNKIIDEKSLIKKYQNEIRSLKEELEQLKRGIVTVPQLKNTGGDDLVVLKQKLEDGQFKLQSRLEQEEEAKAALLSRIQRLTKLILVSTKSSQSARLPHRPGPRRRHSFGEEELAYLPFRRRDLILDDENIDLYVSLDSSTEIVDDTLKEEKKTRKHGLLNWLKPKKRDSGLGASTSDKSSGVKSVSTPSTPQAESVNFHAESRHSHSLLSESTPSAELLLEARQDREIPDENFLREETPLTSIKTIDQIDLMREQQKILSGEVALHQSALKRSMNFVLKVEMKRLDEEIKRKNGQIDQLEKKIVSSFISSHDEMDKFETSRSAADVEAELNEKSLELEVKTADNRIIQEQLNQKICECEGLQETVASLRQQLSDALELRNFSGQSQCYSESRGELQVVKENTVIKDPNVGLLLEAQATEIEQLKKKLNELTESKEQLEHRNQKLAEESSYAKGLASAAAVELKALSEEVAKLMNHNEKLSAELAAQKNPQHQRTRPISTTNRNGRREVHTKRHDHQSSVVPPDVKRELALSRERESSYEAALAEKGEREAELQRRVEESKQREAYLENELANMWVLVAKLKKSHGAETNVE
ncbi:hypothetical protein LguiA_014517 [Lonicera macranthoides]